MGNKRINEKMEIDYIVDEISEGNPGARICLIKLMKDMPNTWIEFAKILDDFEIYGIRVNMIWNDYCKQDIDRFEETLTALKEGKITKEKIAQSLSKGFAMSFEEIEEQYEKVYNSELSFSEYEKLMNVADSMGEIKIKYIMRTMVETGIRCCELKFLTVEAVKKGKIEIYGKVKWTAFINNKLQKDLLKYCNEYNIKNGPIFFNNGRAAVAYTQKNIIKLAEYTDINHKKCGIHSFRKLFLENNAKCKKKEDMVDYLDELRKIKNELLEAKDKNGETPMYKIMAYENALKKFVELEKKDFTSKVIGNEDIKEEHQNLEVDYILKLLALGIIDNPNPTFGEIKVKLMKEEKENKNE